MKKKKNAGKLLSEMRKRCKKFDKMLIIIVMMMMVMTAERVLKCNNNRLINFESWVLIIQKVKKKFHKIIYRQKILCLAEKKECKLQMVSDWLKRKKKPRANQIIAVNVATYWWKMRH